MMNCVGVVVGVACLALLSSPAFASCNTRAGYVANQPTAPEADAGAAAVTPAAVGEITAASAGDGNSYDDQTLKLDLGRDLDTLSGLLGRYSTGAPVLGLRIENLPGFDSKRFCNAIQPILYKPKIEHLADGTIRATVDKERFAILFDPAQERRSLVQDPDVSGRFFWLFPARFGRRDLPGITKSYDAAFQAETVGSDRRRWIAEAYLDLTLRFDRLRDLNLNFPLGWRPTRSDLRRALVAKLGYDCPANSSDFVCLASDVIETNEAAPPGERLARADFMVGDALLENSGISTGIRQLDFGGGNAQATSLASALFVSTPDMGRPGRGYRRPIRAWDVDLQNRWFVGDGLSANNDLSRDEAKRLLLSSHADFLIEATGRWQRSIDTAYPDWSVDERTALMVIAIDMENVTGSQLRLASSARHLCDVLGDQTLVGKRSNYAMTTGQIRRVENARQVLGRVPGIAGLDWSCLSAGNLVTASKDAVR